MLETFQNLFTELSTAIYTELFTVFYFGISVFMIGITYLVTGLIIMAIAEGISIFSSPSPLIIGMIAWPLYLVGGTLVLIGNILSKTFSLISKIRK